MWLTGYVAVCEGGLCLSAGEFTQDNQQRIKHEEEKEHLKVDVWKASDHQRVGRRRVQCRCHF